MMGGHGLVAIVPIRSLSGGKTRLAGILTPEARAALTRQMLTGVIEAARDSDAVVAIAVVSPDAEGLDFVADLGSDVVPVAQDSAAPDLNAAIEAGREWAEGRGASGMLVLFGDLPLLTGSDVRNLLRRDAPVVLAPDRHGTGTNALLLRFGGAGEAHEFTFQYGLGSYAHHVDEAHRLGLEAATSISAGTALDLDTPDDLQLIDWQTGRDVALISSAHGMLPNLEAESA